MKILLAIDGSRQAETAIEYLAQFPFDEPPALFVVQICPTPDLHFLEGEVSADIQILADECRARGLALLEEAESRCRGWTKSVDTRLLDGHPAREIVAVAEREHVDLIVLGARGLGGMGRLLLGSVSDQVVKHAPCSVLVVRRESSTPVPDGTPHRILIADDGSTAAERSVKRFAKFPLGENREVAVLVIIESLERFGIQNQLSHTAGWQKQKEQLRRHLDRAAAQLKSATSNVKSVFREVPHAAQAILETAADSRSDLIVVGSTGKTGWERLLLGSVSTHVLHHAPCSVWVERAPAIKVTTAKTAHA